MDIKRGIIEGNRVALAKLITMAEDGRQEAIDIIRELYGKSGLAYIIGITGPPGVGKSTLTAGLAKMYSDLGKRVGIIAGDPTSPYTGGAILGDRIRMQKLFTDPNIFIRSMGSRGHLGGLSMSTRITSRIMDIFGMDYIFIETVGVGQSEVEIADMADTTIMVLAPGLGDDIQAMKAGIMEIGNVFVVNKCDRDGADKTAREIEAMLDFNDKSAWRPKVIKAAAQADEGLDNITNAVGEHEKYIKESDIFMSKRKEHIKEEIMELATNSIMSDIMSRLPKDELNSIVDKTVNGETDPYSAANCILKPLRDRSV